MGSDVENVVATPISEAVRQHEAGGSGFVGGSSPAMLTLEAVVSEIAHTNIPVLLVGECGSGKQMFAHRIHQLSDRRGPLMKISCAGMRAESFASETGLDASQKSGYRHSAGTAFFDEISELDAACQRNLLYALPDGETKPQRGILIARLISTTSRNLDEEMKAGRFRRELYYRINGVCLRLPALRERKRRHSAAERLFSRETLQPARPGAPAIEREDARDVYGLFLARQHPRVGKCGQKNSGAQ